MKHTDPSVTHTAAQTSRKAIVLIVKHQLPVSSQHPLPVIPVRDTGIHFAVQLHQKYCVLI
ncbi:hypothetical protein [Wolbachia endosymbiont of Folsomia candida]|uniref:hypothetical protein n=1 Tax=Wolbachia endosymbiont of Folsomia candida TaxID=169402 RepID=UPI000A5C2955|nr:hypothetical protein [Wolbachia endosymbiont of Folsomia candida]APR97901.2 hypothetical protein ASM33_01000 [Wolbachia endosymbiont of Folsomia candida]